MKFQIYKDKAGEYRWRLVAHNGKIVGDSGEGYKNKSDCTDEINGIVTYMRLIDRPQVEDVSGED